MWVLLDCVDDEIHGVLRLHLYLCCKSIEWRRECSVGFFRTSIPGAADVVEVALIGHRFVVVHEGIACARIDADRVGQAHPFNCFERVGDFLRQPLISRHDGDAEQVDDALRVQLHGHHTNLTVIADRRVVGIENHSLLGGRLHGAQRHAQV